MALKDISVLFLEAAARREFASKATPAYLLAQMKRMKFLVETDTQVGVWELAPPFVRWIDHLQQISRPVISEKPRNRALLKQLAAVAWPCRESEAIFQLIKETSSGT